jgi:hypothetical protein
MGRYIDLSVTVDDTTMSPPSTNMRIEVTPHRRGHGREPVSLGAPRAGWTPSGTARLSEANARPGAIVDEHVPIV